MEVSASDQFYSDPSFTVLKVPKWRAYFYRFLSVKVWGNLPSNLQRSISRKYASIYDRPLSKFIIPMYLSINYKDKSYLEKFKPPNAKTDYESFQDFFTREFRMLPKNPSSWVWPCEGLLCDMNKVENITTINVKCDKRKVDSIFGVDQGTVPSTHTFTNVFLHNKNYHRIHSPINGTISRIQHVPGDLVVLRPWIYVQNPSLPAFRNERYNIDIVDDQGRTWYLSIVGGPAVGTISISENARLGSKVEKLNELALFYLGSTCCMASPLPPRFHTENTFVEVGASY